MKVEKIAKWNIELIRQSYQNAIDKVNKELGLTGGLGNISYEPDRFSCRFEIFVGDSGRVLWDKHCRKYGMRPEHFGQSFIHNGERFKITGIRSRKCKNQIKTKRIDDNTDWGFPLSLLHTVTLIQELEQ